MVSRSFFAACSLAAALCLQAAGQSAAGGTQSTNSPQSAGSAPSQTAPSPSSPAPLQFHDLPPDPRTPTPQQAEQEREQRVIAAASRMASAQARWGPEISTPGVSATLVEKGRTKTPQGSTQLTYQITGSGFSPNEKLVLVRWPLNSEAQVVMGGLTLNAQGIAVCAPPAPAGAAAGAAPGASAPAPHDGPAAPAATKAAAGPPCSATMKPDQPVEVETTAARGEAIRVALLNEARTRGAATSVVPFPIANQDKACKLQVLLGMKEAQMVLIEGEGFPANTAVTLDTSTYDVTHPISTKTTSSGRLVVLLLSGAQGHDSGDTTVKFAGVSHAPSLQASTAPPPPAVDCAPSVTFHWGKGSYQPE